MGWIKREGVDGRENESEKGGEVEQVKIRL